MMYIKASYVYEISMKSQTMCIHRPTTLVLVTPCGAKVLGVHTSMPLNDSHGCYYAWILLLVAMQVRLYPV